MCIIPLGPSLKEDFHGVLIDRVLGEQREARRLIEEDDGEGAAKALDDAVDDMNRRISEYKERIEKLQRKVTRTEEASMLIRLRTTYSGRVAVD